MATPIRASNQLYIDADLDFHGKRGTNGLAAAAGTDFVTLDQMNNALLGLNSTVHTPVADLAAAKAVISAEVTDKEIMLIEAMGLYRYDADSVVASNDATVIRPTFVASDAAAGRWIKISATITDHNLMSGLQGGTAANGGEYYHLTNAQLTLLTHVEDYADVTDKDNVGNAINASTDSAIADTDSLPFVTGAVLKRITVAAFKTFMASVFQLKSEKDASAGYVGLTLLKINFKNTANTFTSWFVNTNTAARTYTFPDKDCTIAAISDLHAQETATTIGGLINGAAALTTLADADNIAITDSAAAHILKKITYLNLKTILKTYMDTFKDVSGGYVGLTLFKIDFRNTANTFTSFFINANTASRNYTFQDKSGTVAMTADVNIRNYNAIPAGLVNNSNDSYTVPVVIVPNSQALYKNGQRMIPTTDYTILANTPVGSTTFKFNAGNIPSNVGGITDTLLVDYDVTQP